MSVQIALVRMDTKIIAMIRMMEMLAEIRTRNTLFFQHVDYNIRAECATTKNLMIIRRPN